MKTKDTEALERQRAKATKIKAGYNRPTCKNSSYHCTPFYCTQYCNTETVLLIFPSSKHLRCGQVEVRGKILSEFRIIKSASKKWELYVISFCLSVRLFVCVSVAWNMLAQQCWQSCQPWAAGPADCWQSHQLWAADPADCWQSRQPWAAGALLGQSASAQHADYHPLPVQMDNWTCRAAYRHTTAPIRCTRLSLHSTH